MLTNSDLLSEWYRDRGPNASPITRAEEALIVRNLRLIYDERQQPKPPLEFCAFCGTKARRQHHPSQVSK
jgi:hypothetical protein